MEKKFNVIIRFSPPYGDGTMIRKLAGLALLFSPPYGDGTEIVTKSYYPM